jgi:rod shape determining protein RodA
MNTRLIAGFFIFLFGGISSLVLLSISPHDALDQGIFVILGFATFLTVSFLPERLIRVSVVPAYLIVVFMLVFTFLSGLTVKGATRWFSVGPVRIQVSELAKPVLALALCTYVSRFPIRRHKNILGFLAVSMPIVGMVLIQPDLGSSLVLSVITGSVLIFAVRKKRMLIPWILLALISSAAIWQFVLYPYQKQRLYSFLGNEGTESASYNAQQSVITVGSGKLRGRGIGHGVQSNLRFLPEHHTDFFFASFAEETGMIGIICLIVIYSLFFATLWIGVQSLHFFDQILRFALLSGLLFQMSVHVAMNIGLFPITGIPLPFLSSGGSSFISLCLFVAMALHFDAKTAKSKQWTELGSRPERVPVKDAIPMIG